ncbi:NTP transferase domain-containing protein [Rhodocytophaga rosea]|uniref:NTP transferase domain-containing protein n=1 Tax=Rhodocytophaga rosea TaxID=2704465 RepID=A0A6C0GL01_9BACT|nr:sugar phosphate nucleotidyltransferase [Rhodocytophaga rosea]QHT68320.1 NTP transferase domain-containing protein [Rhodocytophaga rosea]
MKAIIPVAGIGSKLRPHTHTQPKALVPVAGKPILAHIIDSLIEGGIREFILIIGYLGDKIEKYIEATYPDIKVDFIIQEPREGLGHAIWLTKEYLLQEKEILIVLGDTIVNTDLQQILQSEHTILGVMKVHNPSLFGVAEIEHNGIIKRLVEKPRIPKSNLALVGIYKINNPPLLFSSLQYLIDHGIKTQNDYHLTDGLMHMIEAGEKMTTIQVNNWYDCGRKETLLEANAILLNRSAYKHIHYEQFPGSIIVPPVSLGESCQIKNSIIGPNVAIGEHTTIQSSIIENSIIGSFSELENVVLQESIIGNDSSLKGLSQSLNIGDNTEINFST